MRTIIGLTGVKTSGKSTAFNLLKEQIPGLIEIQLAKKLKDVCASVLGIERDSFDNPDKKEVLLDTPIYLDRRNVTEMIEAFGFKVEDGRAYDALVRPHIGTVLESPRRVAQYVGTEVLRALDEGIHCIGATMGLPENGIFVVTDMRFTNEFDYFKKNYSENFYPFHIQSNRAEAAGAGEMHPSERQVLETAKKCKRIENNGTIQELKGKLLIELEDLLVEPTPAAFKATGFDHG